MDATTTNNGLQSRSSSGVSVWDLSKPAKAVLATRHNMAKKSRPFIPTAFAEGSSRSLSPVLGDVCQLERIINQNSALIPNIRMIHISGRSMSMDKRPTPNATSARIKTIKT